MLETNGQLKRPRVATEMIQKTYTNKDDKTWNAINANDKPMKESEIVLLEQDNMIRKLSESCDRLNSVLERLTGENTCTDYDETKDERDYVGNDSFISQLRLKQDTCLTDLEKIIYVIEELEKFV